MVQALNPLNFVGPRPPLITAPEFSESYISPFKQVQRVPIEVGAQRTGYTKFHSCRVACSTAEDFLGVFMMILIDFTPIKYNILYDAFSITARRSRIFKILTF